MKFCKYVPCKVNLIEYNPIDDGEFQQASEESINAYIKSLAANDIVAKVRRSRGKDIDAACGQLANKEAWKKTFRIIPERFLFSQSILLQCNSMCYSI